MCTIKNCVKSCYFHKGVYMDAVLYRMEWLSLVYNQYLHEVESQA